MQHKNHHCTEHDANREDVPEFLERTFRYGLRYRHRAGQRHVAVGLAIGTVGQFRPPHVNRLLHVVNRDCRINRAGDAENHHTGVPYAVAVGVADDLAEHRLRDVVSVAVDIRLARDFVAPERAGGHRQLLGRLRQLLGELRRVTGEVVGFGRRPVVGIVDECIIHPGVARMQLLDNRRNTEREDDVVNLAAITRDDPWLARFLNLPDEIQLALDKIHLEQHPPFGDVGLVAHFVGVARLDVNHDDVGRPVLAHFEQQRLLRGAAWQVDFHRAVDVSMTDADQHNQHDYGHDSQRQRRLRRRDAHQSARPRTDFDLRQKRLGNRLRLGRSAPLASFPRQAFYRLGRGNRYRALNLLEALAHRLAVEQLVTLARLPVEETVNAAADALFLFV